MQKKARALEPGVLFLTIAALTGFVTAPAHAQELSGEALVEALRGGGYVLVMRHASASVPERRGPGFGGPPGGAPGGGGAGAAEREPELDDHGIGGVTGMRHAFRELEIPVGDVLTSPTLRARQHVRHFGFGDEHVVAELGTDDMQPSSARSAWLAAKAAESPRPGTNTVIVTHAPNIRGALDVAEIDEGEALVVQPGATAVIVARVPIEEWAKLAVR